MALFPPAVHTATDIGSPLEDAAHTPRVPFSLWFSSQGHWVTTATHFWHRGNIDAAPGQRLWGGTIPDPPSHSCSVQPMQEQRLQGCILPMPSGFRESYTYSIIFKSIEGMQKYYSKDNPNYLHWFHLTGRMRPSFIFKFCHYMAGLLCPLIITRGEVNIWTWC